MATPDDNFQKVETDDRLRHGACMTDSVTDTDTVTDTVTVTGAEYHPQRKICGRRIQRQKTDSGFSGRQTDTDSDGKLQTWTLPLPRMTDFRHRYQIQIQTRCKGNGHCHSHGHKLR